MQRKRILARAGLFVFGLIVIPGPGSFAQSGPPDRISGPIAGSSVVWLEGNRRPIFQPENDLGPADSSLKLENIALTFKLTPSQQADLTALLAEQQDPSSPNYHHWLTPEQYADRFGLSPNDIKQVVAWLQTQGFQVTQTARGRSWVSLSGTLAQVQAAFQTEIHNFSLKGQTYYANASEPAIPASLADVVLGIRGLDNYRLQPRSRVRHVKAEPKPNLSSAITGNTFVAPGDFAVIYDVQNLYNGGIDGTGQKIAVVGQTDLYSNGSDITAFRAAAGLPANSPSVVLIPGASDPGVTSGDIEEASLDVEWSGAVAKNATIIFVNGGSGGVFNAFQYAIDDKTAPVISISYGACEADWTSTDLSALAQIAQQANTQGQTIVAAAGDSGAADCDVPPANSTSVVTVATHGLAVDAPASVPYVTGMGGSEFNEGSGNYWQATTSAGGDIITSALSYIPEMVWNDTSSPLNTGNGLLAGGGGISTFFTTKPTWQTGPGVPSDGVRDVPDLSLNASPIHDPLLVCVQGSCVNGFRDANGDLNVVGGTSAAAPTFAGIVALINQQTKSSTGQGNINPVLYSMAQTSPAAFHDITTGNNKVPCQSGSTDCPASGELGYSAGVGYDQASGLGSVDASNLVMDWSSTTVGLPAPALTAPANGATGVALSPAFSWSAVSGNDGYRIMVATTPADLPTDPAITTCSSCTLVEATSENSISYVPSSPLAAGTYYWQVQAIEPPSSSGTAAWSEVSSFTTSGGALTAPTLTAPANGATTATVTPAFTWTAVTGSTGYRILIAPMQSLLPTNPAVGVCGACAAGATTSVPSYTPAATTLVGGTTYYWEVQALAPSGQSAAWSNVASFTTPAADFSLAVSPTSLTIAPGASGTSTLTLTPINNFSAATNFTCSVASTLAGVTCVLGTLGSNNTATVTIAAASSVTGYPSLPRGPHLVGWWWAVVAVVCLLLTAFSSLRSGEAGRRVGCKLRHAALGAGLAVLLLSGLSCGSSGGGGGGSPSSPAESGTVVISGSSGTTTHTTSISVSIS